MMRTNEIMLEAVKNNKKIFHSSKDFTKTNTTVIYFFTKIYHGSENQFFNFLIKISKVQNLVQIQYDWIMFNVFTMINKFIYFFSIKMITCIFSSDYSITQRLFLSFSLCEI